MKRSTSPLTTQCVQNVVGEIIPQNVQTGDSLQNKPQCVAGIQTVRIMLTKMKVKVPLPPSEKKWYSSDIYIYILSPARTIA